MTMDMFVSMNGMEAPGFKGDPILMVKQKVISLVRVSALMAQEM